MNIIFFGDSICYGEKVSPHQIFATRLSEYIGETFGETFTVVNSSINGNTTRLALERMPFDVQRLGVELLILQLGMNDCNYWETDKGLPRVSPEAFVANLHEIIERAKKFGARKIILNTNHPTTRTEPFPYTGKPYEDGNIAYNKLIRQVAADPRRLGDTVLIDMEHEFRRRMAGGLKLERLLLEDGLHLSVAGHALYYEIIKPLMKEICAQLAS